MTSGFQCPSVYRQTTDCTEGGGLTREHCSAMYNMREYCMSLYYIENLHLDKMSHKNNQVLK